MILHVFPGSQSVSISKRIPAQRIVLVASVPVIIGAALLSLPPSIPETVGFTADGVQGFAYAWILASYGTMIAAQFYMRQLRHQREVRATSTLPQVLTQLETASDVEQYFSRLIQVNLRNMEQYYLLVRQQTEKSYRLTQAGAAVGFVVLVAGIILSFFDEISSASKVLTIGSGALIEFISAVFFYIYNTTIRQLNTYHDKLVNVQDTMLALKVAQIVKDDTLKDRTMAYLTRALTQRLLHATDIDALADAEMPESEKTAPGERTTE